MSDSSSQSVEVLCSWTCTKRVIHPWDGVKVTSVTVEFDGSSYLVATRQDNNCTFVERKEGRTSALSFWARVVKLSEPRPLFPKKQIPLPGMGPLLADYDIVETSVQAGYTSSFTYYL